MTTSGSVAVAAHLKPSRDNNNTKPEKNNRNPKTIKTKRSTDKTKNHVIDVHVHSRKRFNHQTANENETNETFIDNKQKRHLPLYLQLNTIN